MFGPNPNSIYPNEQIKQVCFTKNVVKNPNIIIGEYIYYDDIDGADDFEKCVTHHYDFIGDKLIIGKFCAIAKGVQFVMNGANHRLHSVTTYPWAAAGRSLRLRWMICLIRATQSLETMFGLGKTPPSCLVCILVTDP